VRITGQIRAFLNSPACRDPGLFERRYTLATDRIHLQRLTVLQGPHPHRGPGAARTHTVRARSGATCDTAPPRRGVSACRGCWSTAVRRGFKVLTWTLGTPRRWPLRS